MNSDDRARLQRALKDLSWSIESPSLIDTQSPLIPDPQRTDWESYLEDLPQSLRHPSNHRVGKYFETLIHFWLQEVLGARIIAQNLQLIEEGQTKGELDFIFQKNEVIHHWETAVKFYLYHDSETILESHFIGPNTNDTFERKIDRLFHHQLPLSSPQIPNIDRHEAHVKGRIFYHPHQNRPSTLPKHLSSDHQQGIWIHSTDWRDYSQEAPQKYYHIIKKPHWLAPETNTQPLLIKPRSAEDFYVELRQHFSQTKHALLVAAYDSNQTGAIEQERLFIVDEYWPSAAKSVE